MDTLRSCPACRQTDALVALGVRHDRPYRWRPWVTTPTRLFLCVWCMALVEAGPEHGPVVDCAPERADSSTVGHGRGRRGLARAARPLLTVYAASADGQIAQARLGFIYPIGLPSMMGLCCAGALVEVLEQRRVTGRLLAVIAATSLVTPIPLYYWWLFHHAPVWSRSAFWTVGAWPPLSLMAWLYAPALLLALPVAWRRVNHLLALWPLLAVGSGILTGAQPQRMLAGVTIPLSLLAVQTLAQRPRLLRPAVLGLGLGAVLLPFLFVAVVRQNAARVFMPEPVAHVGAYLATRTTQRDVILADYDVGNRLAALTPARVIAGHGSQTLDLSSALPIVQGYYTWPGPRRLAVEDYYHVSYIVVRADLHPRLAAQMAVDRRYALVYITGSFAVFRRTVA